VVVEGDTTLLSPSFSSSYSLTTFTLVFYLDYHQQKLDFISKVFPAVSMKDFHNLKTSQGEMSKLTGFFFVSREFYVVCVVDMLH